MGKKKRTTGGTPATARLEALALEHTVHAYDPTDLDADVSLGEAVAGQLGVDPARMFKTLIALVDGKPVCGIVPVSRTLNLKALARAAGGKRAEMADPKDAERWTGYVTGGISPVGQAKAIPRFVDVSAEGFESVIVSGGKRGLQLELSPEALLRAADARRAPIADEGSAAQ